MILRTLRMSALGVILGVGCFLLPTQTLAAVVYQTDFSSDPHLITDDAVGNHWDAATSVLTFHTVNGGQGPIDRYAAIPTSLDPSHSFTLTWRQMMASSTPTAVVPFGILNSALVGQSSSSPNDDGYVSVFSGIFQGNNAYIGYSAFPQNGFLPSGGNGLTSAFLFEQGKWYQGKLIYDAVVHSISYSYVNEETGQTIVQAGPFTGYDRPFAFGTSTRYIGMSMYVVSDRYSVSGSYPGTAEGFIDDIKLTDDSIVTPPPPTGPSNVLFLPGIESSNLYKKRSSCILLADCEDQLWVPNADSDARDLFMKYDGTSKNPAIYTRDATRTAYGFGIYDSFLNLLEKLKTQDHVIADYAAVPYDWRLSLRDILHKGTVVQDGNDRNILFNADEQTPFIESELARMASSSKSGKVTIVAHSNGGLVAKALVDQLRAENSPLLAKIDKLIFVAVPHLGTPSAMAALLHGYNQGLPGVLTEQTAREFGNNAPSIYNLLPSDAYFAQVSDSVVTFDAARLPEYIQRYGSSISTPGQFRSFLKDSYSRSAPTSSDLILPATLNSPLLDGAAAAHIPLDSWAPPEGLQVYDIVGWGVDTLSNLEYTKTPVCVDHDLLYRCKKYEDHLTYNPHFVVDGDGTVVSPSALWVGDPNMKRYWVNAGQYNRDYFITGTPFALAHGNILTTSYLQDFVTNLIENQSPSQFPAYISEQKPVNTTKSTNLEYTLHSPLTLSFVDTNGNTAGFGADAQHTIVGSRYVRVGEVQWLSVPKGIAGSVVLKGITDGSFTLDVSEKDGDTTLSTTSFSGIPSTASTTVTLPVSATGTPTTASTLALDYDSNGVVDATLSAQPNTSVQNTAKVPLLVTPQNMRMTLGGAVPSFTTNFSGFIAGDTPLHNDVAGSPVCTTTATPGSAVGIYPITCTVGTLSSRVYTFTFATGTLQVVYRVDGMQVGEDDSRPLWNLATVTPVFERGERITVSIQPKRNDGTVQQSIKVPVWFAPVQGGGLKTSASSTPVVTTTTAAVVVWDSKKKQYTYTWDTRTLKAGFWYRIGLKLDDSLVYTGVIGLK